jgi:hypothetical protein
MDPPFQNWHSKIGNAVFFSHLYFWMELLCNDLFIDLLSYSPPLVSANQNLTVVLYEIILKEGIFIVFPLTL